MYNEKFKVGDIVVAKRDVPFGDVVHVKGQELQITEETLGYYFDNPDYALKKTLIQVAKSLPIPRKADGNKSKRTRPSYLINGEAYGGTITVRMSPQKHLRIGVLSAHLNTSMNALCNQWLSERLKETYDRMVAEKDTDNDFFRVYTLTMDAEDE